MQIRVGCKKMLLLAGLVLNGMAMCAQSRPNILWITIEDTSPRFIGCYGNAAAHTPNIDRMAKEGVRFTSAFSTNTVCSPSRTTLITGVRTYAAGTGHHRSKIRTPDWMYGFPFYMRQAGYYTSNNAKTDYNLAGAKLITQQAWNESSATAGWWNRKPGQPFFAVFNFNDSHQSRTMTDPYDVYRKHVWERLSPGDRIADTAFPMPPIYRNSAAMRKQMARVYNAIALTDNSVGKLLERLQSDHLMDSTIIFFFSDHGEGIPRGKTNGIDLGYRVPFIVWLPPMYKDRSPWQTGTVTDELIDFEDLAPTLISMTGAPVPGYMNGRILMGSQRIPPKKYIGLSSDRSDNGIDMVRSITDGRYLYSRNYMPFMPEARYINYMEISAIKQIMRQDLAAGTLNHIQRLLFEPRPAEFLFDTEQDPWECKNLVTDIRYKAQLDAMRQELDQQVLKTRDVMFLPEYELAAITAAGRDPYTFRLDEKQYPLRRIYAAARLSGKKGRSVVSDQIRLLNDTSRIVRYWAAVGLRAQPPELLKPYRKVLLQALTDPYPPARISIASVVYEAFSSEAALTALEAGIADASDHLSLMTLNYLLYTKHKPAFVPAVQKIANDPVRSENVRWAAKDLLVHMGQATYAAP
ncbi:MAG: sulfatase [Niabella sp.]|nr:sulfatase [Niabella sp.]